MSFNQKDFHFHKVFPKHVIPISCKNPRDFLSQLGDVNSGARKNMNLKNVEANTTPSTPKKAEIKE